MSLIRKLEAAATERSLGKSTVLCYSFWVRKLYAYAKIPGSQWTGELVREWMLFLADQNYSPVSRKQALNAVVESTGEVVFIKPTDSAVDKIVNALLKEATESEV